MTIEFVTAGRLVVGYEQTGDPQGWPVVLEHGFPYDVRAFDAVVPKLAERGARVIVPYLRGFGPTRFVDPAALRSGEQAAIGTDLLALLDALGIERAGLAGYDWGGRAACVVSALYPERARFLLSGNGYLIQDIAAAGEPVAAEAEHRLWYQYYFHGERGRAGLARNRAEFCRLLWRMWSPTWAPEDSVYAKTAPSFDNPDFVEVVIHSYRHRFGLVSGDPELAPMQARLAALPPISIPTITLDGDDDGVTPAGDGSAHARRFTGDWRHSRIPGVGHNLPQEAPDEFASAVLALHDVAP